MIVELIQSWEINGIEQETLVTDKDERPAECETWSTDSAQTPPGVGLLVPLADGQSWTCAFTITRFDTGRKYSIVIRETREMARAGGEGLGNTGPNFIARIPLPV
ncbi:hypothetical protein [Rhizobium ruizarguesonis]|uniref:hypothetical protein n=1 Tax=Rhizobium ruizarguesonis TaxID=2081791 RepID=UPI0013B71653|nr:hypothetical protein [Rhizobium ruizarguesonis]NEH61734.1 hypothetical protein [Rhizobium ruizarguesonis]